MAGTRRRSRRRRNQNRKILKVVVVVSLLLVLLVGGMLLYYFVIKPAQNPVVGGKREAEALRGSLKTMTEEEIQAQLDQIVDEGMFRISIASTIVGYEDQKVDIRIENPLNNRYLMKVNVYLDETGEEIYATDLIDPGYYIQSTMLDKKLEVGEHPATAVFTALYPDTGEIVGTVAAQVKFLILPVSPTPTPTATPTASPTPEAEPTATPAPQGKA